MSDSSPSKGRKPPDKRPARARYWARGLLAYRKVRAILHSGFKGTVAQAYEHWLKARGGRRVKSTGIASPNKLERFRRCSKSETKD